MSFGRTYVASHSQIALTSRGLEFDFRISLGWTTGRVISPLAISQFCAFRMTDAIAMRGRILHGPPRAVIRERGARGATSWPIDGQLHSFHE
jgi:hypothetical protein